VLHAGAHVHQPARAGDEGGQQVRGEHVDGEHVGEPVGRLDPARLGVADGGVVDDGVGLDRADLLGQRPHRGDARQVTDHDVTGRRDGRAGVLGPPLAAGVQDDVVPAGHQPLGGQAPDPVGRSGDEDACHVALLPLAVYVPYTVP
jgi:hypothetical protein